MTRSDTMFGSLVRLAALGVVAAAIASSVHAADAAGRLTDLAIAERDYVDKAPAFTPEARAASHKLIVTLRAQAKNMTDAQFALALARVAALADNGHDALDFGDGAWFPKLRLPVRMIWFPDALIVARAAPEHADLLGASIVTVEGLTPAQLMDRLRPLQGGTDVLRRWQINWIFHSAEALNALGIAKAPDRLNVRLKLKDGSVVDRTLIARPVADVPPGQAPSRYWIPAPWIGETEKGWRAAVDAKSAPLYLQDADALFRMAELPALDALYVQFRSNFDEGDQKIAPFVAAVSERLKKVPPHNIVVDVRFDTGGDNTQNRVLMKEITERVPGRIYLLVGNYTFSAGIASAAALVHDGGAKVTIVGSDMADRMHWWSEHHEPVCLPHSRVCFPLNSGYWDLVHGCKTNPACYGDQFDVNVPSLEPTLRAPLTSADWLAAHDPGLEAITADFNRAK